MFVKGAKEHNDIPQEQADAIFDQIAKFAGYGFNKSHAAAYALIAYQTAWLKANYPVEFMAASMALDVGNTEKLATFKQECDRMGLTIIAPDINRSFANFEVEEGEILYALGALKGVGIAAMERLVEERRNNGPYEDVFDMMERIDTKAMNKKQLQMLAAAGAFDHFDVTRSTVFNMAEKLMLYANTLSAERDTGQESLFAGTDEANAVNRPPLEIGEHWDHLETLKHEFDAVGLYLSAHPLDEVLPMLQENKLVLVSEVEEKLMRTTEARFGMAGVLIRKQERVSQKTGNKFAFITLSDPTGMFEVMLFSEVLSQSREVLNTGQSLFVSVDAQLSDGQVSYLANSVSDLYTVIDQKRRHCSVTLSDDYDENTVETLHSFLNDAGKGSVRVRVNVPCAADQKIARIALPGGWSVTGDMLKALEQIKGVKQVVDL
jgi:DNA polymerase-3 subunit alpha